MKANGTDRSFRADNGDAALELVSAAVTSLVEDIFDSLRTVAAATRALWDRIEESGDRPGSSDLAALRDPVIGELQRQAELVNGVGFVVADGALADVPRYLEWWRPDVKPGGEAQRLELDLSPGSEYFYDYSTMEWYSGPRDRGVPWVHGPYLDYTGVDLYVCTFTLPVTSGRGKFIGVVGADVPVARLDAALLPTFAAHRTPLALTNSEGRVIVANDAEHVAGSKLEDPDSLTALPVSATPWSLVSLRSEDVKG
ncbi:cache domain-containing protein [Mycolicibacterium sp.]|uniref:cache domain-containing protein n=1 Tax=Mycolicibacterium sp. TaxID=2320850 RepID=UPI0037C5690D